MWIHLLDSTRYAVGDIPASPISGGAHAASVSQRRDGGVRIASLSIQLGEPLVRFRYSHVAFAAYCLLIVPVLIFFFGWLRWFYALPAAIALLLGFAWLYLTDYRDKDDAIEIPVRHFVLLLLAIGAFVALSGNCGFYRGGYDIPWRNAILRDLIDFQWPVVYSTGFALAYYFIFWMVPALVGKLFGWAAAMIALWVWQVLIVGVSFLLIVRLVGATTPSRYWMVLVLFLFWSGLNLIGAIASRQWAIIRSISATTRTTRVASTIVATSTASRRRTTRSSYGWPSR